jgi:outer membrane protein TolC
MKRFSPALLIILLVLLTGAPAAFSKPLYSLQELIQKADQLSETIKIAEDDIEIAVQEKKRALSVLIPRATSYAAMTEYKDEDLAAPDTLTVGLKLTQSFTLNGKELIALDVTKRTIESKEFVLEKVRSEYLLQVSKAYYDILSAQRSVEIAQADVERLTAHKDAVNEKLAVGNVTKTDLYRAQAELSKSLSSLVKAQNGVLQRKASLQNLVDVEDDFELEKEPIPSIEHYDTTLKNIETFALAHRYEIKEAQKNLEIAKKTVTFKKSDYWPSVSLEAGYKETDISYDSTPSEVDYDNEDLYFTGELVFTLYDGGLRRAQIRQALADVRKAQNALALQKKKVSLESSISFLDYQTAKSTLDNLQDELKSAQENFNAVQMQFKYGMADSIDMMDANTLLVTAQRSISDAQYTLFKSVLQILYTRGDLSGFLSASAR